MRRALELEDRLASRAHGKAFHEDDGSQDCPRTASRAPARPEHAEQAVPPWPRPRGASAAGEGATAAEEENRTVTIKKSETSRGSQHAGAIAPLGRRPGATATAGRTLGVESEHIDLEPASYDPARGHSPESHGSRSTCAEGRYCTQRGPGPLPTPARTKMAPQHRTINFRFSYRLLRSPEQQKTGMSLPQLLTWRRMGVAGSTAAASSRTPTSSRSNTAGRTATERPVP